MTELDTGCPLALLKAGKTRHTRGLGLFVFRIKWQKMKRGGGREPTSEKRKWLAGWHNFSDGQVGMHHENQVLIVRVQNF
jgi:hypothetical protein